MLTGCGASVPVAQTPVESSKPIEKVIEKQPAYATLCAVGDNIIYNTLYLQAQKRTGKSGKYDFAPVYANVKNTVHGYDIAMVNEESPLASQVAPLSSYPLFNAPTAVGDALCDAGFDVINQANNHALDQGEKGLLATLDYWKAKENITVIGAVANRLEDDPIRILEKNDIRFAFLGYTEMTNGMSLPKNAPSAIFYTKDTQMMKQQITAAKKKADIVVVSVHWGEEYTNVPNDDQVNLAQQMANWGADIILGSHPHVIQPVKEITAKDGRKVIVYYSLGNFVSHQKKLDTVLGGMADIRVKKDYGTGKTTVEHAKFVPLVMQGDQPNGGNLRVYLWSQYTEALANRHYLHAKGFTYSYAQEHFRKMISSEFLFEKE